MTDWEIKERADGTHYAMFAEGQPSFEAWACINNEYLMVGRARGATAMVPLAVIKQLMQFESIQVRRDRDRDRDREPQLFDESDS